MTVTLYEGLPGCLHFSSDIDRIRYRRKSIYICWVFGSLMKTGTVKATIYLAV
jgi:hypothetical protein